jgi:phage repressor protein C with HTH and peptisase S24 domain
MRPSNAATDHLIDMLAEEIADQDARPLLRDERLVNWLARDLCDAQSAEMRAHNEAAATAFANRTRSRISGRRAARVLPINELKLRRASMRATVAQSIQAAAVANCAPLLELAAAAGSGRALWDEMCDEWIEVPNDTPGAKHVAIRIAGDSMLPVLHPRDVILVKLETLPVTGDLVVARLEDDGYVVKRYEKLDSGRVELTSFNPAYDPIVADQRRVAVLGTVVARFHVTAQA